MNADKAIRPWLVAVGTQYGVRQAYPYRVPDPSTRTQEPYFTYRVLRSRATSTQSNKQMSKDGYTAIWGGWRTMDTIVRVKIYRMESGIEVLTQCAVMAEIAEPIKRILDKGSCRFKSIYEDLEDETPDDINVTDGDYKDQLVQRMDVIFSDNVYSSIRETNGVVETINSDLGL